MKYLAILFLSLSLNAFAQGEKQIYLQTNPDDNYVIRYTSGDYTFMFDFNDFLESIREDEKTTQLIRDWMVTKIKSQGFFDLNDLSQSLYLDEKKTELSEITGKRNLARLIDSGNLMVENTSGKQKVSSLVRVKTAGLTNSSIYIYTYTNPASGDIVFQNEIYRGVCSNPSF